MAVELYFNKELSDITFDIDSLDEWKSIVKELGLENQEKLTKGSSSPVQYPFMNNVMKRVYETLCPCKVNFKNYKVTTIPLDVLKQISFSVKEGNFKDIQIWYDDKSPDPLVVGSTFYYHASYYSNSQTSSSVHMKDKEDQYINFETEQEAKDWCTENNERFYGAYKQEETFYLIARWGDELRPFEELKSLALKRILDDTGGELQRSIKEATEKLNCLKENAVSYLNGNIDKYKMTGQW